MLQLRAFGKIHAVRDNGDRLRPLPDDLLDGGAEFRRCAGHNAQRNEFQLSTSALGGSPKHGM